MECQFFSSQIYLLIFERSTEKEGDRRRERNPHSLIHSQKAVVAGDELVPSQKLGTSSRSPQRVQDYKDLAHLSLLP